MVEELICGVLGCIGHKIIDVLGGLLQLFSGADPSSSNTKEKEGIS